MPQLKAIQTINCGFEGQYCQWENETLNTQFNWTLNFKKELSYPNLPEGAVNSNGYLYLETRYYLGFI